MFTDINANCMPNSLVGRHLYVSFFSLAGADMYPCLTMPSASEYLPLPFSRCHP